MSYQTFSDLVNDLSDGFLDLNGATNGNITGENAEKFAQFYSYWSNYLTPLPAFMAFLAYLPGALAKALYQITASLEHVFNNMFKLFGLFGYLGDSTTVIGQFFHWFQILGTTLFSLVLVVSALTGVFTKPVKWKGVITNFLLVTAVTAVLPLALTSIAGAMAQDAMNIQTVSSEAPSGTEKYSSLSIQPMKNNVVDLKVLIDNDFSTELFPLDNYGYIKPVKEGSTPVNNITDSTEQRDSSNFATRIDFGATYGATNSGLLKDMEDKHTGIKGLFLHKLNANNDGVESITAHKLIGQLNAFEPVYLRYKVNWVGMFLQYIILIVLLISMSVKFVKSVFDIIIEAMISPIQGYSSLSSSKKYKELLRTIGGALAGIFFEVVIMRVTLEICRDLPTVSVSAISKLSGGFFDGLNMWEQCLAAALVYIGIFFAAMQGVSMIERWLGVSTGHSETAQQLLGAMMMGNAFATGAGALGKGMMGAGQFGMDMAGKVPGAVASGSKVIGNSLAVTGGGLRGTYNSIKDQGFWNSAKGGVSNAVDLADVMAKQGAGKVKDAVGGVADNLSQKEQAAHDAVYRGLKNHSLPEEAKPVSLYDPDAAFSAEQSGGAGLDLEGGSTGGGITDPTVTPAEPVSEAPFQGVSDPTVTDAPKVGGDDPHPKSEAPGVVAPLTGATPTQTEAPKTSSARSNFQQSMSQMHYMNQQMQQAGQRMQGQSHIKGAEIDETEE